VEQFQKPRCQEETGYFTMMRGGKKILFYSKRELGRVFNIENVFCIPLLLIEKARTGWGKKSIKAVKKGILMRRGRRE